MDGSDAFPHQDDEKRKNRDEFTSFSLQYEENDLDIGCQTTHPEDDGLNSNKTLALKLLRYETCGNVFAQPRP